MENQAALVSSSTQASSGRDTPRDPRTPRSSMAARSPIPIRSALANRNSSVPSRSRIMGLVVRPTFTNTLPDLPMDPKFVISPLRPSRFVDFKSSSLDILHQHEVHFDPNMNASVDLVIPPDRNPVYLPALNLLGQEQDEHDGDAHVEFDEKDAKLLEDEDAVAKVTKFPLSRSKKLSGQRSESHRKSVAWLRRTEYISTEQTRFQPQFLAQERIEAKIGVTLQKERKQLLSNYDDRGSRIKAIEKTFEDVKKPIMQHFAKPGVVPVEVTEVFPDFELWKYPFAMVSFDSDPSLPSKEVSDELASGAMIRGVTDDSGDQFVAYFLPTDETFLKLRQDKAAGSGVENSKYEYEMAREYNWQVKPQGGVLEHLFFRVKDNAVYYNEIETRISLSKRRTPGTPYHQQVKSMLTVTNVRKSDAEFKAECEREKLLEPKPDYDAVSDGEDGDAAVKVKVEAADADIAIAGSSRSSNPQTPVDGSFGGTDNDEQQLMVNVHTVNEESELSKNVPISVQMPYVKVEMPEYLENNVVPDCTSNAETNDVIASVEN